MCVTEFLRRKRDSMAPSETVLVDREWIDWLLMEHACECGTPHEVATAGPASKFGFSTRELADMYDASPSTIKAGLSGYISKSCNWL